ncbi:MAG: SGNH/GDSL hydrolase family protein [Actinobacteria bacterium]|nr:SGNH/GDSL hydrolase family protein [Actinomycetota bacterium]NDA95611.1 SGNH/GDSL hydrolase family protein [Actinomycetota bacterium]NDH81457.1 SGNH/GDSL hydrolase family protein [Actinomycetota bacterium]NDH99816.1 SGNH/GDSL hydrolase family protein [Actinomycetota bacterium]
MDLVRSHPTFVVLGDSAAYGTGDEIKAGQFRGWAGFLADAFQEGCDYFNYSRPGAKSNEVLAIQLPKALRQNPDICAVIVGGNDLLRNNFDPVLLYNNLRSCCQQLLAMGSEIIMVELHDPNQLLKLPKLMRQVLGRRVNAVNAVYRKVALEFEIVTVKTRAINNVHDRKNWHIDRMHPGPQGHFMLARNIADQLRKRGWAISMPYQLTITHRSRSEKITWLLRNGTPWFFKRSFDLLPAAMILMIFEFCKTILEKLYPARKTGELAFLSKIESDPTKLELLKAS